MDSETLSSVIPTCSICYEQLNENLARMKNCGHVFHDACVRPWIHGKKTCPECRETTLIGDLMKDFVLEDIIHKLKNFSMDKPTKDFKTPTKIIQAIHPHNLVLVNSKGDNQWKCDHCSADPFYGLKSARYRCGQCPDFDACERCVVDPIHPHPLEIADPRVVYKKTVANWKCDLCGASTILGLVSPMYHCYSCANFDLCVRCVNTPRHTHQLSVVDPQIVYRQKGGQWYCDWCGASSSGGLKSNCNHCNTCREYDLCDKCLNKPLHSHPLTELPPLTVYPRAEGHWKCDVCLHSTRMGLVSRMHHCSVCNIFDVCDKCLYAPLK